MLEVISEFWSEYGGILLTGTRDTLVMVLISTLFAYLLGLPLGVALTVTPVSYTHLDVYKRQPLPAGPGDRCQPAAGSNSRWIPV